MSALSRLLQAAQYPRQPRHPRRTRPQENPKPLPACPGLPPRFPAPQASDQQLRSQLLLALNPSLFALHHAVLGHAQRALLDLHVRLARQPHAHAVVQLLGKVLLRRAHTG